MRDCDLDTELVECCFCGKPIDYVFSNNPHPLSLDKRARCCHLCNGLVLAARCDPQFKKYSAEQN